MLVVLHVLGLLAYLANEYISDTMQHELANDCGINLVLEHSESSMNKNERCKLFLCSPRKMPGP